MVRKHFVHTQSTLVTLHLLRTRNWTFFLGERGVSSFHSRNSLAFAKLTLEGARYLDSSSIRPLLLCDGRDRVFWLSKLSFLSQRPRPTQLIALTDSTCGHLDELCRFQTQPLILASSFPNLQLHLCLTTMGTSWTNLGAFASWDEKTNSVDAKNDSTDEISRFWNGYLFGIVFLLA